MIWIIIAVSLIGLACLADFFENVHSGYPRTPSLFFSVLMFVLAAVVIAGVARWIS